MGLRVTRRPSETMFFNRFCSGPDLALSSTRIYVHTVRLKCCAIIVKLCKERERDAVRKVVGCDSHGNGWFNDGDPLYLGYIFHARNVIIKILI